MKRSISFSTLALTLLLPFVCSCNLVSGHGGSAKHDNAIEGTVSPAEPVVECGEALTLFLQQNGRELEGWPFKDWGYHEEQGQLVRANLEGITLQGPALRDFIGLEAINGYAVLSRFIEDSREAWLDRWEDSDTEYKYCGDLHLSDSFETHVFTDRNDSDFGHYDAFALLVKDGKVLGRIELASEGYGLSIAIQTNRISKDTFIQSHFSLDLIDEDGNQMGGYYRIQVSDNGKIRRRECPEALFDRPTWHE